MRLSELKIIKDKQQLQLMSPGKKLINTVNAYSFCVAQKNHLFAKALQDCDYLIPDGIGIVKAGKFLKYQPTIQDKIAGWDLFKYEMSILQKLSEQKGTTAKVLFLGSSQKVLNLIGDKVSKEYPNLTAVTYSPPFKPEFTSEENQAMIEFVNAAKPDLMWVGMTAPKQECWAYSNWDKLDIDCHVGTIGAVFDFYAGTMQRAPQWWRDHSLEWLHRFLKEPKRTWRRYLTGNIKFANLILKEKISRNEL